MGLTLGLGLSSGASASAGPANPLPPALSSPLWGYRADQYTPGATATWTDRSGSAFGNATNSAAVGTHPTLNAIGTLGNSRPSLGFAAASSQILTIASVTSTQPFCVFTVLKLIVNGANQVIANSSTNGLDIFFNGATSLWTLFSGSSAASSSGALGPMVMCAIFNGASSALYINDSSTNLLASSPGIGGMSANSVAIGASTTLASFFNGEMGDTWGYSISPALVQRQSWFAYAATRYAQTWS